MASNVGQSDPFVAIEAKVPLFDVNHAIHRAAEERFHAHCAANATPLSPPGSIRPHINIVTRDHVVISALVDSGAEVCMGHENLLSRTKCISRTGGRISILGCHGEKQFTKGEYNLVFDIVQTDSTIRDVSANLHLSQHCSSEVLLGMDFLSAMGAVICTRTNEVKFFPEDRWKLAASNKPIFLEGLAAAAAERVKEAADELGDQVFTVSAEVDIDIPANDIRTARVVIDTPNEMMMKPGAKVILSSGISPFPVSLDGMIFTVENKNRISIPLANKSPFDIQLLKDRPIPGMAVEPLTAYQGPVRTDKADLVAMAHHHAAVSAAKKLGVRLVPIHSQEGGFKDDYDYRAAM